MKMLLLGLSMLLGLGQAASNPAQQPAAAAPSSQSTPPVFHTEEKTPADRQQRMDLAARVNGLRGLDIPWHLKATYQVFGSDGQVTDTGTYEEWRAGDKQYRIALHGPSISAEEYGTDHGVFRIGEQEWPLRPLSWIRAMIEHPVNRPVDPEKTTLENYERKFGNIDLPCTALIDRRLNQTAQDAAGYCFASSNAILIYATEHDRAFQKLFEQTTLVSGHYLAYKMQILLEGKPWLKVHIDKVEGLDTAGQQALTVPASASLVSVPVEGAGDITVGPPIKRAVPAYPSAAKQQRVQGTVILNGIIGTDGHLRRLQVLAGPPMLQQPALDAVRQWVYTPYLSGGKPIEVETEINVIFRLGG